MSIEIRPLEKGEFEPWWRMLSAGFAEDPRLEDRDIERKIVETQRAWVAVEGDDFVAGAAAVPFQLTVPGGGTVPCAGVTQVATLPSHRRLGLAAALMRRQLDEFRDTGQSVAYLWASEAAIYQRFGYGLGSLEAAFRIRREKSAFLREARSRGRVRLAERGDALKLIPDVYERVRPTRPGMVDRSDAWLEYVFKDRGHDRHGSGPLFFAIYEDGDGPQGYAAYRVKHGWSHTEGPDFKLEVEEMVTATGDAYGALWRYCFGVDLVRTVHGWKRPADEPLLHMLVEPRALALQARDGTWIRLVDVPAALEARRYSHEGRIVLELDDEFGPWNDGTYELDGGPDGATCRPTGAEPDLSLQVEDLGAAYLGAISFRSLAAAGRVTEQTPGALRTADAMFSSSVAPWCPWIF